MDEFSQRYEKILFERDYPPPPLDMDATVMEAAGEAGKKPAKPAAEQKPMTAADVGAVTKDTIVGLLKGVVAAAPGVFGDIESIARLFTGHEQKLLTTEEIMKLLPQIFPEGTQVDPRRRSTAATSQEVGTFLPVAPIGVLKAAAKAIKGAKK